MVEFLNLLTNISALSIILFLVGIVLIAIELFEPGFGFFGVFGIISLIVCIFITAQTVIQGIILTAVFFVIVLIMLLIFLNFITKGRLPKKLVLHDAETADEGFTGSFDAAHLYGKEGVLSTACRPAGIAEIGGARYDVVSRGEFIEKGVGVVVIEGDGNRIVVKAV